MRLRLPALLLLTVLAAACGSSSSGDDAACEVRAVVEAQTDYRQYDVFLIDREGGLAPLTDDRLSFSPDVAPDGSWLVLVKAAPGSWSESFGYLDTSVQTMAFDGTDAVILPQRDGWNDTAPVIRPDGHALAFIRRPADATEDVHLMISDRGGEQIRVLANLKTEHAVSAPAWSPDGSQVAVAVRGRDYSGTVLALDAESGDPRREWPLRHWQDSVAWSAGGDQLVISSSNYETPYDVSIIDIERGAVAEVAQPDGGSWTNAQFDTGSADRLNVLWYEASIAPKPQHAMKVTLDGAVVSRIELDQRPMGGGEGTMLIRGLSTSECFTFDFPRM